MTTFFGAAAIKPALYFKQPVAIALPTQGGAGGAVFVRQSFQRLIELAPKVSPAANNDNITRQAVVSTVPIGMQITLKIGA